MNQLDDLKRLAEAATQGPWFNNKYDRNIRNFDYEKLIGKQFHIMRYPHRTHDYPITHEMWEANADYVAAANPTAILSLIASHEQLQSKFEEAVEVIRFYAERGHWGNGAAEIDPCDQYKCDLNVLRGGKRARDFLDKENK